MQRRERTRRKRTTVHEGKGFTEPAAEHQHGSRSKRAPLIHEPTCIRAYMQVRSYAVAGAVGMRIGES